MKRASAAGALSGLLAAGTALGVGELAAAFVRPEASPIVVVANRFILLTPEWLKRFAIAQFGTDDKTALRVGILVVLGLFAVVVGLRAVRRPAEGVAGIALFGLIGVYCALTTNAHRGSDVIPTLVGTAAALAVLMALVRTVRAGFSATDAPVDSTEGSAGRSADGPAGRRRFLVGAAGAAAGAALAGVAGRGYQHHRFDAARSRAAVVLPAPAGAGEVAPVRADLGQSPVPWSTTNQAFYRIDTAFNAPQVDAATWKLTIHGMVDHPVEYRLADLLAMPLIERWITMMCVSYEIGGDLIGNALFRGVPLAPLLAKAGLHPGADQLVCRSVDGMTIGAPVAQVTDGRDAMLAVGMNGQALPVEHGFPVRMVVPGLYGYVSACKWITDIEVTTFARYDAYWVQQGWLARLPIQLGSRIDTPRGSKRLTVGQSVPIAGVAWHQHVGVGRVQVQIDGGEWTDAKLGQVPSNDTWRQWTLPWTVPAAGEHRITVRAFDADGTAQDTRPAPPYPGAASGLHRVTVRAS